MGRTDNNRSFKKKNFYKLQDGDMVFRILPPLKELANLVDLGELANKDSWSKFHSIHFGYKNSEGKSRTFGSPLVENYDKETKTRTVKVPDAALERLNELKNKLAKAKEEGNGPLEAKLNALVGFMGVYSIDKNHHMNVVDLQGNIGVLKIRHKAKLALDEEIKRLESEGVDPLSADNGRFFRFTRSGRGNETGFKVVEYMEKIDGGARTVVSKLTSDVLSRIKTEAFDLDNITAKLTSEEVAKIVSSSDLLSGKSPACDEYFDARWKAKRAANNTKSDQSNDSSSDDGYEPDDTPPVRAKAAQPTPVATTASGAQASAAILASSTQTLPAGSVQSKTQGQSIDELSDEEFFKQIGATT